MSEVQICTFQARNSAWISPPSICSEVENTASPAITSMNRTLGPINEEYLINFLSSGGVSSVAWAPSELGTIWVFTWPTTVWRWDNTRWSQTRASNHQQAAITDTNTNIISRFRDSAECTPRQKISTCGLPASRRGRCLAVWSAPPWPVSSANSSTTSDTETGSGMRTAAGLHPSPSSSWRRSDALNCPESSATTATTWRLCRWDGHPHLSGHHDRQRHMSRDETDGCPESHHCPCYCVMYPVLSGVRYGAARPWNQPPCAMQVWSTAKVT